MSFSGDRINVTREVVFMIYTHLTKKAMKICFNAHVDQVDKTGVPYVFHPFHLAEQMDDEESVCVALLHDVVEDTDWTFNDLIKEGFTENIINALRLLTHLDDTPYMEYVKKIKANPLAKKVKLADLKHNSDLSRLDLTIDKLPPKLALYKEAIQYLEN